MLKITIPKTELFDERSGEFIEIKEQTLALEHSLVSLSKWESKWKKPFLRGKNDSQKQLTDEEVIDYIRCMTLTQNVNPNVYLGITPQIMAKVAEYIEDPMTATWFSKESNNRGSGREVITSEIIYYLMVSYNIPFECQKWHLNRLLTLIRVCNEKNKPQKKMSKGEWAARQRALNAERRSRMHSRG